MSAAPDAEFDASIATLESATDLLDPEVLLQLLQKHPHASGTQLRRLWEVAVAQSTLADIQVANDAPSVTTRDWRDIWTAGAVALRDMLVPLIGPNGEQMLTTYW